MLAIPLLIIVVGIYNVIAFTGMASFGAEIFSVSLISGDIWSMSIGDLLVAIGLLLLYVEVFKSTRSSSISIVDHLLSMMLFIICILEFVALRSFGTTTFFLIMLMTFIDVIAGFTVTISTARRDFGVDEGIRR